MSQLDTLIISAIPSVALPYGMTPSGVALAAASFVLLLLLLKPRPKRLKKNDGSVTFRF